MFILSVISDAAQQTNAYVSLSKIPNCALGTVGSRHLTRIFFPRLYTEYAEPGLRQEQLIALYDNCIRPAVMEVIPAQASHWPVDYLSALVQARDTAGRLHFGSLALPPSCLIDFCTSLITRLDAIPGFEMAYFVHELRGHKGGTAHQDGDRHSEDAFDTFFEHIDMARVDASNWLIDVGLELSEEGSIVQWSTHAHSSILKYLMPNLSNRELSSLQTRRTFHLDNAAHLQDFAGFRCEPGQFGRAHNLHYINVYTTDKCTTYQLHKGIWRRRDCKDLYPKALEKLIEELDAMSRIYKACCGNPDPDNRQLAQEGSARLEIRVPLLHAQDALRDVPEDKFIEWCYCVDPLVWW